MCGRSPLSPSEKSRRKNMFKIFSSKSTDKPAVDKNPNTVQGASSALLVGTVDGSTGSSQEQMVGSTDSDNATVYNSAESTVTPSREQIISGRLACLTEDQLWERIEPLSREAVQGLKKTSEEVEDWSVWEDKDSLKIEKKSCKNGGVAGRGIVTWKSEDYGFKEVVQYLWDPKSKEEFDEYALGMVRLCGFDDKLRPADAPPEEETNYSWPGCHIVYQAFKGRFGIAGRDFLIVTRKHVEESDTHSRLIIGAISVSDDKGFDVEKHTEKEEDLERYEKLRKGLVRGFAMIAGYDVIYEKATKIFKLTYIYEADVKIKGIPNWIVNRAKLDQLRIVKNVPPCIENRLKELAVAEAAATANEAAATATANEAAATATATDGK